MSDPVRILKVEDHTDELISALSGHHLQQAANAGMLPIVNRAQQLAPYLTGDLRDSIHVEPSAESDYQHAIALGGTNLAYAARQEFGFDGPDSLGRVYHDPGRPYLRPAFDEMENEARRSVARALSQMIKAAVR